MGPFTQWWWPLLLLAINIHLLKAYRRSESYYRDLLIAYNGPHTWDRDHFYELSSENYYSGMYERPYANDTTVATTTTAATVNCTTCDATQRKPRRVDPTFYGHPKTIEEVWEARFAHALVDNRQTLSLVALLNKIILQHLYACIPIVLFDVYVGNTENYILETLLRNFPTTYMAGKININYTLENKAILNPMASQCRSYIVFLSDAMQTRKVIGSQLNSYIILVPRSSQWKLQDFLASKESRDIINLLVIGESYSINKKVNNVQPYVLYTHRLYTDGLGSSQPEVLTSWMGNRFSRNSVNLFPTKLQKGFSGHRFTVMAAQQPPFVMKTLSTDSAGNTNIKWDGLEIRILTVLSRYLNFTFDIVEPSKIYMGSGDAVVDEIKRRRADIGIGGVYVTKERNDFTEMSVAHSVDCASFLTLMSSALPRYRAILGPFQWPVWLAIILIYLLAIFPLAFSDKMTLSHLIGNWSEIENMFWYVFGTFTNSLTFAGENSWSKTSKASTRLLIGIYWVFTIIITACYTGSIIAFITMPVVPDLIDNVGELNRGFFRVTTLDRGGWERWFSNSSHEETNKLMKKLSFVNNINDGISNVTHAFLISCAFLGSKAELEYMVKSNLSIKFLRKTHGLHVSRDCFALYGVSYVFPLQSVYRDVFNNALLFMQESGIIRKLFNDVLWTTLKSPSGHYREVAVGKSLKITSPSERGLTLADTEGMFLLMLIGFVVAGGVLISEWVGGCSNRCREYLKERAIRLQEEEDGLNSSIPVSSPSSANQNTPSRRRRTHREYSVPDIGDSLSSAVPSRVPDDNVSGSESQGSMSHKRSISECFSEISQASMQELCEGPGRRHSTIVFMEGRIMSEEKAKYVAAQKSKPLHSSLHSVMERDVGHTFKYLDELPPAGSVADDPSLDGAIESNQPGTSRQPWRSTGGKSIEGSFGEKLLH